MVFHQAPNIYTSEVHLKVENMQRSLLFYKKILGFQVLTEDEAKTVLTVDGQTSLITLTVPEDAKGKEPRTTGLYHFAILLPNRSDLASCLKHLVDIQYPLQGASDHYVSEAVYLADPDGNGIEIYVDRPPEKWRWINGFVDMGTIALDIEGLFEEWNGQKWGGMPQGTIMGHIHLHVDDLHKAERFYCEGLGFEVVTRYGEQALFISTGRYHHHIGLNIWNGRGALPPSKNSVGLEYYILQFPSQESRKEVIDRLESLNYPVEKSEEGWSTTDPSGTKILLSV